MSRKKQLQDANVCMGISGSDDIEHPGISIVEDYFKRETEENRLAEGLHNLVKVECGNDSLIMQYDPDVGRSELEVRSWQDDRQMSELEAERTNRPQMDYAGYDLVEDVGIVLPRPRVTETV